MKQVLDFVISSVKNFSFFFSCFLISLLRSLKAMFHEVMMNQ